MSGLTQDNPQSNADRMHYMQMVRNAINVQNNMKSGEPDNTITVFGSLYAMREVMGEQHELRGAGKSNEFNPYDRTGGQREIHIDINSHNDEPKGGEMVMTDSEDEKKQGSGSDEFDRKVGGFLPLVFAPAYYGLKKLFGGAAADEYKEKSGGASLLDMAMPMYSVFKKLFGGDMKKLASFKRHYNKALKSGGMVLSPEAQEFHKKRGGRAPTGADFSGADIVNSEPLKNSGPDVGTKAALGDRVPNTNAGQGVQTWTEYPNKNLSNQDIKEATATVRDIQNDFPVANKPNIDQVYNSIMKLASGKKNYTEKSVGGALKKKSYAHLSKIPANKLHEYIQAGKRCGGVKNSTCGGALKKRMEEELKQGGFFGPLKTVMQLGDAIDTVGKIPVVDSTVKKITSWFGLGKKRRGGAAVASPNISEGKRAPIISGIIPATQIDGFQDPRTTGMGSQAGTGAALGGKKKRNRKPMTAEQKRAFALRMAEAKLKRRKA